MASGLSGRIFKRKKDQKTKAHQTGSGIDAGKGSSETPEYLRPLNQGLINAASATTFETFVQNVYLTTEVTLLASSTQDRNRGIVKNHLVPTFGALPLRDLTPLTLQKYISGFQIRGREESQSEKSEENGNRASLASESVDKIRDVLSSILQSAIKYGYLITNPAEKLQVPSEKRGKRRHKPFIRPAQFAALVALIQEPYATMVYVAVYTGLRVSELIGLRWGDIHEHSITIDERYCRGDWGEPKSDASNTTIPVNQKVIERINRLRTLTVDVKAGNATRHYRVVKSDGPDDLVFQSVRAGQPMRGNNILSLTFALPVSFAAVRRKILNAVNTGSREKAWVKTLPLV